MVQMDKEERIKAMATIMVAARRQQDDVGELVAAALHDAANKLRNPLELVMRRPGSWEADITMRMAWAGGRVDDKKRMEELSTLFVEMAAAFEDGGDVLSQAMGQAVDELGGLREFAGMSRWYHDLVNIGRQYSQHAHDPWE